VFLKAHTFGAKEASSPIWLEAEGIVTRAGPKGCI